MPMESAEERELAAIANKLRQTTIRMLFHSEAGHPGGSLSAAEILTTLYFRVLRIDPARPDWVDRDRFILSKGHAAPIYYAALVECGYFPSEILETYDELDSILQAHPDSHTPGIDASSGSLGQGLSVAIGMALGSKLKGQDLRVYALLGDGEMQEGQVWEAAMSAPKFKLDNLVAIVDHNRIQLVDFLDKAMPIDPIADKWQAFNWNVIEVDGHSIPQLLQAFTVARTVEGQPTVIIAHTVKGKGVSFMENSPAWHAKAPNETERDKALAELSAQGVE